MKSPFEKIIGIYIIRHTVSEKRYVGSSANVSLRIRCHKNDLNNKKHPNKYLQRAWNKYGKEAFEFKIIEVLSSQCNLLKREQFYIDLYKSHITGYNARAKADMGAGSIGPKMKIALRAAAKKQWADPLKREIILKSLRNEETKTKKSNAHKALWLNPEYKAWMRSILGAEEVRRKISEASKKQQRPPAKGRKVKPKNPLAKKESSERMKACWLDKEYGKRVIASHTTPEARAKSSKTHKKLWENTEHRSKMIAASTTPKIIKKRKKSAKQLWKRKTHREKIKRSLTSTVRKTMSDAAKAHWANPELREKMTFHWHKPKGTTTNEIRSISPSC